MLILSTTAARRSGRRAWRGCGRSRGAWPSARISPAPVGARRRRPRRRRGSAGNPTAVQRVRLAVGPAGFPGQDQNLLIRSLRSRQASDARRSWLRTDSGPRTRCRGAQRNPIHRQSQAFGGSSSTDRVRRPQAVARRSRRGRSADLGWCAGTGAVSCRMRSPGRPFPRSRFPRGRIPSGRAPPPRSRRRVAGAAGCAPPPARR